MSEINLEEEYLVDESEFDEAGIHEICDEPDFESMLDDEELASLLVEMGMNDD